MKRVSLSFLFTILVLAGFGCKQQTYSTGSPPELIDAGWNYYRVGTYDLAQDRFEQVLAKKAREKTSKEYLMALLGLGSIQEMQQPGRDTNKAAEYYYQIIETAPDSEIAPWALLRVARMEHTADVGVEIDTNLLRTKYDAVIDKYPGHPAATEAFLFKMETYIVSLEEDSVRFAIESIDKYLKEYPDNEYKTGLYGLLARSAEIVGESRLQMESYIKSYENMDFDPLNPKNDWAESDYCWRIATVAEYKVGDFDTALKYYKKLIEEVNPADRRRYLIEIAIKRLEKVAN